MQIAEELFDIPLRKEGNVPSSKEELLKLSDIKDALKILTNERKIIGSLIEDPITKEEVMCYSTSRFAICCVVTGNFDAENGWIYTS